MKFIKWIGKTFEANYKADAADEKLKDALDTANSHIQSIEELIETKIKLMEQR